MATIALLNKKLLTRMKELNIPQRLQDTILNLSLEQKQAMLQLYSRQAVRHNKPKRASTNVLDAQLLNRMKELLVPKHIQSQILTLPKAKKRILLDKYKKNTNTNTQLKTDIINQSQTDLISESVELELDSVHSYEVDIELLYLMKQNNMSLASLNKLKSLPKWKKQQYIERLQQQLPSQKHRSKYELKYKPMHMQAMQAMQDEKFDDDDDDKQSEIFDIMDQLTVNNVDLNNCESLDAILYDTNESKYEQCFMQCLRCLQNISINNINHTQQCIFHIELQHSHISYDNIEHFIKRNNELHNAKNFKYKCCNRKYKGYFINYKSQQNGCCQKEKHLFYKDLEGFGDDMKSEQIEGTIHKMNKNHQNHEHIIDLCGKWKMFVYFENNKTMQMIRDINIIMHDEFGQIEGHLIGTTYIEQNTYNHNCNNDLYSGQLKGNRLLLTYHVNDSKHFESYALNVKQYQLNGQFTAPQTRGTCQWFKIQNITGQ